MKTNPFMLNYIMLKYDDDNDDDDDDDDDVQVK
jgi:hypothetical protein